MRARPLDSFEVPPGVASQDLLFGPKPGFFPFQSLVRRTPLDRSLHDHQAPGILGMISGPVLDEIIMVENRRARILEDVLVKLRHIEIIVIWKHLSSATFLCLGSGIETFINILQLVEKQFPIKLRQDLLAGELEQNEIIRTLFDKRARGRFE